MLLYAAKKVFIPRSNGEGSAPRGTMHHGSVVSTPSAALVKILSLPPIDPFAENRAVESAGRLTAIGELN